MRLQSFAASSAFVAITFAVDIAAQATEPRFRELAAGSILFDDWAAQSAYWAVQNHERGGVLHGEAKNDDDTVRKWEVKRILLIDWFQGDGRKSLHYEVRHDGMASNMRHVYSHASQGYHQRKLSQAELEQLRKVLSTLPISELDPPINHTVLVSFMADDKWQTAVYDNRKLPDEFEQALLIVGERFETLERHEGASHP